MVGSVSSSSSILSTLSTSTSSQTSQLSSTQKESITSILSQYDGSSLSQEDAVNIVNSFEEAGITPSKEFADELESLGFDAQEIGGLAGVSGNQEGMPPPPPQATQEEETSLATLLESLLEVQEDDEESTSNTQSFEELLDYTSKILSLNDETKTEVLDMLEKYSTEDNEYTKEETSNLIKTTLNQTLNNSDNYNNRISFYA